jgi:hypothetical protein
MLPDGIVDEVILPLYPEEGIGKIYLIYFFVLHVNHCDLWHLSSLSGHSLTLLDDQDTAAGSGNRPGDQEEVPGREYLHHPETLEGDPVVPQMAGHVVAFEDPGGE